MKIVFSPIRIKKDLCGSFLWLWAGVSVVLTISEFLMGAMFLVFGGCYEKHLRRSGRHMADQNPNTIRYSVDKTGYTTKTSQNTARSTYSIIHFLCEEDGYFVVMLDRRRGFVLDKAHFLTGTPEAFAAFLEERTGQSFQRAALRPQSRKCGIA